MKILAGTIIVFIFFLSLGAALVAVLGIYLNNSAWAEEYSPLDFLDGCDKFEITVGMDETNGRYATYHYEFKD